MRLTNAEIVQYFRDITEIINRRENILSGFPLPC